MILNYIKNQQDPVNIKIHKKGFCEYVENGI